MDRVDLASYQEQVLLCPHQLDGYQCVVDVCDTFCPQSTAETEPHILWLINTFALDVHKRKQGGLLELWPICVFTARLLHIRHGFDVNTVVDLGADYNNFAEGYMVDGIHTTEEQSRILVWCGARQTKRMHPNWRYLFQRRSRCAHACRALISRRFQPTATTRGLNMPRDLREMLARALWESRVEKVWDL